MIYILCFVSLKCTYLYGSFIMDNVSRHKFRKIRNKMQLFVSRRKRKSNFYWQPNICGNERQAGRQAGTFVTVWISVTFVYLSCCSEVSIWKLNSMHFECTTIIIVFEVHCMLSLSGSNFPNRTKHWFFVVCSCMELNSVCLAFGVYYTLFSFYRMKLYCGKPWIRCAMC